MPDRFGDKGRIEHMLKAIKTIESYTQKSTFFTFGNTITWLLVPLSP